MQPSAEVQAAARRWLEPVRTALGSRWLASYITGSALTSGFDAKHSHVNVLIISRDLEPASLGALAKAIPHSKQLPQIEPLFMTRRQIEKSIDVFPIEWLDIIERHLLLEGEDVLAPLSVPNTYLRLQCEQELRGKHLRLRQSILAAAGKAEPLRETLVRTNSGFQTLYRTLLRLRGESPPASTEQAIGRLAELFSLDARALLAAHLVRYRDRDTRDAEIHDIYREFLVQIERLVAAIDELRVP